MSGFLERFGLRRKNKEQNNISSAIPSRSAEDGLTAVTTPNMHGIGESLNVTIDFDSYFNNQKEKIELYRELEENPFVNQGIREIVDEAIVEGPNGEIVRLDLSELPEGYSKRIKDLIYEEFENVLGLMDWRTRASELFLRWFVDGQLALYKIVNKEDLEDGIQDLRIIDNRYITKITSRIVDPQTGVEISKQPAFIYNESFNNEQEKEHNPIQKKAAFRLNEEAVAFVTSGISDKTNRHIRSHLHKAIKPANQLSQLEDALLVYRISRAPERLVFYVDTGQLPATKATQYVQSFADKFKSKATYNQKTGKIENSRHIQTIMENYWLPRKDGGRGTEISTLSSSGTGIQNDIEMLDYFQRKLYRAMHIPISRLQNDNSFPGGRVSEITRDEIKFAKFISRLRNKFSEIFLDILETQLLLKKILTEEEWEEISTQIKFDWESDSVYSELKNQEVIESRLRILRDANEYVKGKTGYFSKEWVQKNILNMNEEDIDQISQQIEKELKDGTQKEDDGGF